MTIEGRGTPNRGRRTAPTPAWRGSVAIALALSSGAPGADACGPITPLAHVERRGDGPVAVVLIPGWMCDWTVWSDFMDRNAAAYTMRAVTLPGLAGTPPPPAPDPHDPRATPWLDNAVVAIVRMIEADGLDRPLIVGHSMGGGIALRVAMERPDLIRGVVSIDGFPAFPLRPPVDAHERAMFVSEAIEPGMRSMTREQWVERHTSSSRALVSDERRAADLLKMFLLTEQAPATQYVIEYLKSDLRPRLAGLQPRALFIAAVEEEAEAFNVAPEALRQEWREQVAADPDAQLVFFEKTRHFVVAERPAELSRAIGQFLRAEPVEGFGETPPAPAPRAPPAPPAPEPRAPDPDKPR